MGVHDEVPRHGRRRAPLSFFLFSEDKENIMFWPNSPIFPQNTFIINTKCWSPMLKCLNANRPNKSDFITPRSWYLHRIFSYFLLFFCETLFFRSGSRYSQVSVFTFPVWLQKFSAFHKSCTLKTLSSKLRFCNHPKLYLDTPELHCSTFIN